MARTYKISEICGDWALQIKSPGEPIQFLYFKSRNNAELVKAILEWEDAHLNEAVPYKPTLTPPNEPLTLEQLREMDGCPAFIISRNNEKFWALVNLNSVYADTKKCFFFDDEYNEYGKTWVAYRRPPEGEEDT